jgi:hypothetical protein
MKSLTGLNEALGECLGCRSPTQRMHQLSILARQPHPNYLVALPTPRDFVSRTPRSRELKTQICEHHIATKENPCNFANRAFRAGDARLANLQGAPRMSTISASRIYGVRPACRR